MSAITTFKKPIDTADYTGIEFIFLLADVFHNNVSNHILDQNLVDDFAKASTPEERQAHLKISGEMMEAIMSPQKPLSLATAESELLHARMISLYMTTAGRVLGDTQMERLRPLALRDPHPMSLIRKYDLNGL